MAAELQARTQALEERELRLNQREAQIGEREQKWRAQGPPRFCHARCSVAVQSAAFRSLHARA